MRIYCAVCVLALALLPTLAAAKGGGHSGGSSNVNSNAGPGSHQQSRSLLRGNNGDNGKGGRYLAGYARKLPGTRKSSTVTVKRGITPEKVEAGSENVRRVKQ